jgi:hypothetical protein
MNIAILRIQACYFGGPLANTTRGTCTAEAFFDTLAPCLVVCFSLTGWGGCHRCFFWSADSIFAEGIVLTVRVIIRSPVASAGWLARRVFRVIYRGCRRIMTVVAWPSPSTIPTAYLLVLSSCEAINIIQVHWRSRGTGPTVSVETRRACDNILRNHQLAKKQRHKGESGILSIHLSIYLCTHTCVHVWESERERQCVCIHYTHTHTQHAHTHNVGCSYLK